jgi:hypothetical protein
MTVVARPTRERRIGIAPSTDLLPTDGALAPVRPSAPSRALAVEALRLLRRFDDPSRVPAAWAEPRFVREIGLVRAHLAPMRSRATLAASFSREAFHTTAGTAGIDAEEPPGAVRVAYAIRWLELGDGRTRPTWPEAPSPPAALD